MSRRTLELAPLQDALFEDGRCVLLVEEQVLVLTEIATAIVQCLQSGPGTPRQLAVALEPKFGKPPSGSLEIILQTLLDQRILA